MVLVIDGANVVGTRPDGWWRDRPGAARRLAEKLEAAQLPYDRVVLVLEGAHAMVDPRETRMVSEWRMPTATETTPWSQRSSDWSRLAPTSMS
jgi:hypothetical protein